MSVPVISLAGARINTFLTSGEAKKARVCGYIPVVSSLIGLARSIFAVCGIGVSIWKVGKAVLQYSSLKETPNQPLSKVQQDAKESMKGQAATGLFYVYMGIRGLIEIVPVVGNLVLFSTDKAYAFYHNRRIYQIKPSAPPPEQLLK